MNIYSHKIKIEENNLMIKNAIEMITGKTLQYIGENKNRFIVCEITVILEELEYRVQLGDIETSFVNKKDLLSFILVSSTKEYGLYRLKDRCLNLNQMNISVQKHITRLCNFELFGTCREDLYDNILYTNNKPSELSEIFGVNEKLIREIRRVNRKAIVISIINIPLYANPSKSQFP